MLILGISMFGYEARMDILQGGLPTCKHYWLFVNSGKKVLFSSVDLDKQQVEIQGQGSGTRSPKNNIYCPKTYFFSTTMLL